MNWLRNLWRWIVRWFLPLPVPPSVVPVLIGEKFMADVRDGLVYSVDVPALPKPSDLVEQILCVHYETKEDKLPIADEGGEINFMVPQDVDAKIHLIYVDNGGNKSEGPFFTFKAIDEINAFTPPGFGEVKLVDEVFDVDWDDSPLLEPPVEIEDDTENPEPEILPPPGPQI